MAFVIKKTKTETVAEEPAQEAALEEAPKKKGFSISKKPAEAAAPAAKKASGFLKGGAAAKEMMEKAEVETQARKAKKDRAYRFRLKVGEDAMFTFLDGVIDPKTGIFDIPYTNEHRVKIDGHFEDIVCIEDQEPCPLCAAGEQRSFVGYFSGIDHRPREWEKDGKTTTVPHSRRPFVAKSETLKALQKIAEKNEGTLAGTTFEISRTGEYKAAVGDLFDKSGEHTYEEIKEEFGEDADPFDYEKEVAMYLTAEQMIQLGLGKKQTTIGSKGFGTKKKSFGAKASTEDDVDDVPF